MDGINLNSEEFHRVLDQVSPETEIMSPGSEGQQDPGASPMVITQHQEVKALTVFLFWHMSHEVWIFK